MRPGKQKDDPWREAKTRTTVGGQTQPKKTSDKTNTWICFDRALRFTN